VKTEFIFSKPVRGTLYGGGLYARTYNGVAAVDKISGVWTGAPHRFRVDWNSGRVGYWIDGVVVASHSIAIHEPDAFDDCRLLSG
jgi:hypothetical protein